ncbi:MAG: glycerophosphodiester phosphodiesterase family protein [Bacteroidota bacterium]|nr:glycerophosphodiester phosphodiesterase family protein [Bacteroidota bacterium]
MSFSWLKPSKHPIIVAHRGSSALAPENTLASFRQAIADGADAIELDVRLSKDNEVVVFHDRRVDRTTNGSGLVKDLTLFELKKLNAGGWFHRRFSGETIPTLDEVFEVIGGRVGINIEIKADDRHEKALNILERGIELINKHQAADFVLISSFDDMVIRQAKILQPEIATGILYSPLKNFRLSIHQLMKRTNAHIFISARSYLKRIIVSNLHEKNIKVGTYTINDELSLIRVMKKGVDFIYSDNPAKIFNMRHLKNKIGVMVSLSNHDFLT